MASRGTQLVRTWQLTARKSWNIVGVGGALLAIGGPVCIGLTGLSMNVVHVLVAVPGLLLLAMWAWAGDGYRVHAGRAEMRLFGDRLEVPRARHAGVDVLPLANLSMRFVRTRGHVDFIPVSDVLVLHLDSAHGSRQIAHHLVGSPELLERIAEDIARTQRGEPPTPDPAPKSAARNELERKLDAELSRLD